MNFVMILKKAADGLLAVVATILSFVLLQLCAMQFVQMPKEARMAALEYFIFIFLWVIVLIFCLIKRNRPILKALGRKAAGNNWKNLVIGIVIGLVMNSICVVIALLHGDISLSFMHFQPFSLLIVFAAVFIQSSAEEVLCRGFLYQRLIKNFHPAVAIIGNGLIFAAIHMGNEGVTFLPLANIVIVAILFSLMVYYMDSIWCAMGAHTAWNFSQNIIYGLPNSGSLSTYSVFGLDMGTTKNSFAYNVNFGIEGTLCSTVVILLFIAGIWLWGRRYGRKPYDVWQNTRK